MTRFVGAYVNKIDRKGRVSVPAEFRASLAAAEGEAGPRLAVHPSFTHPALEAGGLDLLENAERLIDGLDPYGEERDAFALAILADARKLLVDGEGRILLPPEFIAHAGLSDAAVFAGMGARFQIWEPGAFEAAREKARAVARNNRALLSARRGEGA